MASKPCLPVSRRRKARAGEDDDNTPIEFDDVQSMDAAEYLSRVMKQGKRLPEILHRSSTTLQQQQQQQQQNIKRKNHVPIEGSAASLSYLVSDRTAILPPPSAAHAPTTSAAWVDTTLANFSQLRLYLDKMHKQQQQQNKAVATSKNRKQPVPPMKDRPGWHIFCVGKKEAHGNAGSYFADDDDDDDKNILEDKDMDKNGCKNNARKDPDTTTTNATAKSADPWQQNLPEDGYYPSTSLVLQLDQVMLRHVIAHLAHYVQEGWYPSSVQRTLWLYALLARLEKPLHRNDAAVLYGLLKTLTRARATTSSSLKGPVDPRDRECLARINVLITIVGVYFEQGGGYAAVMEAAK